MADVIVGPVVEKSVEKIIAAIFRQFNYLFRYNRNIRNLKAKVEGLENRRNDVQAGVDEDKRNAIVIKLVEEKWLKDVDNLKEEADKALDRATNSEMRCLFLRCPNLKTRYLVSRKATKKTAEIVELQEAGRNFVERRRREPLKLLPYHGSEALKSRITTKKEIIKALEDKYISIVGICGPPGVGKTTMVKEIMTEVEGGLFDKVAMVVVSKDADIITTQDKLADMLGLKFDEKTNEIARAARLAERLTHTHDNKKRILVILDDLWTEIDLKTLGIPSSSHLEGLKILLTSRFERVCKDTGALRNIEVRFLPSEEAFLFFQDVAKISNDAIELKAIAEKVAEECKGLPLALEVVGKTLRNEGLHAWKDALNQLRNFQHDDEVFSSIQFSYDYLKSDEHRFLLLLCSLFPEDASIPIEILVRYARGLEMFKNTETLSDTRNRVKTVFDNLKSCHLLLSGEVVEEEVKLHDVIRDFCLSIVSKGEHRYMVKHNLETEWPEHDTHESYSAVSLTFHGKILLPSRLPYGNLKFLRLLNGSNSPRVDIPEEFLGDLQELRVLDFSRVRIRSPIQLSAGLRTLCLNDCYLEFGISFFGSLKKLEILTFHRSVLSVGFPHDEMVELSNLRLLDLRFQIGPRPVPPGFLSGMKKLEELYLGDYFNVSYEEKRHIIEEVSSLKALNTLQIGTDDIQFLMQLSQACSAKLERFRIATDHEIFETSEYFRRFLCVSKIDPNMFTELGMKSLMRRSDELQLSEVGWRSPVIELDEDGFTNLKSLKLHSLDSEYLIDAAGSIPSRTFHNLEILELFRMGNLKEICNVNLSRMEHLTSDGVSKPAMFCNLKSISVDYCHEIKRLFSESVAKCMVNLQNLVISSCPSLEEVVSMDTQENENFKLFPKLKELDLNYLSRFVSFSSQSNAVGLRQTFLNNQVELPDMEKLKIVRLHSIRSLLSVEMPFGSLNGLRKIEVESCFNLVSIAQSNSIKLLQNLEILQVRYCRGLNVIFDFEGLNVNDADVEIGMLDQLKSLELVGDKLLHITRMVPEGIHVFQNLKSIKISHCSRLRYLFPTSMINSLVGLETLWVDSCDEMEEVFGREGGTGTASKIEFRQLMSITLIRLPRFKMFCCHNYELVFPSLDHLRIEDCPVMPKSFPEQLNAPKLKKVEIGYDEFVDVSNFPNL